MKISVLFAVISATAFALPASDLRAESLFSIPSQDELEKAGLVPSLGKSVRALNLSIVDCLESHSNCNIEAVNKNRGSVKVYAAVFQCGLQVQMCMTSAQQTYAENIAGVRF